MSKVVIDKILNRMMYQFCSTTPDWTSSDFQKNIDEINALVIEIDQFNKSKDDVFRKIIEIIKDESKSNTGYGYKQSHESLMTNVSAWEAGLDHKIPTALFGYVDKAKAILKQEKLKSDEEYQTYLRLKEKFKDVEED